MARHGVWVGERGSVEKLQVWRRERGEGEREGKKLTEWWSVHVAQQPPSFAVNFQWSRGDLSLVEQTRSRAKLTDPF